MSHESRKESAEDPTSGKELPAKSEIVRAIVRAYELRYVLVFRSMHMRDMSKVRFRGNLQRSFRRVEWIPWPRGPPPQHPPRFYRLYALGRAHPRQDSCGHAPKRKALETLSQTMRRSTESEVRPLNAQLLVILTEPQR